MTQKNNIRLDSTKAISPDIIAGYITIDTNDNEKQTIQPKDDLSQFIELLSDDDVSTAIRIIVDAILKSGYKIVKSDELDKKYESALNRLIKDYQFDDKLVQIITDLILFRKAYINVIKEPVKNGSVIVNMTKEIHVLSPAYIRPVVNKHGDVLGYIQQVPSLEPVKFTPDELVELDLYPTTSGYWGYQDLKSLYEIVKLKNLLQDYIAYVYNRNRLMDYWRIKGEVSGDAFKALQESIRQAANKPTGHLLVKGDVEHVFERDHQFIKDVLEMLYYLKGKIYEFFGVPPIYAGFIEGANRSAGDIQARFVFNDKVSAFKERLKYLIDNILFKAIGLRAKIIFNPYDRLELKDRVQLAMQLKAIGVSNNTLKFFLSRGYLPEEITFSQNQQNSKRVNDEITNRTSPSRQPVDQRLKKINQSTGYESTTREDQIFGK